MAEWKLECAVYGEGIVIPVKIARNVEVRALQEAIINEKKGVNDRFNVDPATLTLYLAGKKEGEEIKWLKADCNLKDFLRGGISTEYEEMRPTWILDEHYFGENFQPGRKKIQVLVELPQPQQNAEALAYLMPPVDQGWTAKWLSQFRMSQLEPHNLPLARELKEFVERELPVKITLRERIRDNWMTKMKIPSSELMKKIFRVENSEPCVEFLYQIRNRVVNFVVPGDTETSFISFWDDLIRNVLNFVGIGKSFRDSASTGPPDYLFMVDSVCVFRGEEAAPGVKMETPRCKLFEKLSWTYGDAPYLFGYVAVGYEARLYAITHENDDVKLNDEGACNKVKAGAASEGDDQGENMGTIELGVYDLNDLEGRFCLMLAILSIARLLRSLASLCPDSVRGEYQKIIRDQGIKVFLEPSRVVKCFPEALFQRAKVHVEAVYKVLKEHAIPNVDRLDHADQNSKRLIFKPRGQETKPANLVELFYALANVLQALVKLHAASWMHRDIRWPNVIKNRDGHNSWFLVDFMDAAQSPQFSPSGQHLSRTEHAPEMFSSGSHTTAVDVWSVGRLIQTCGEVYGSWYDAERERTRFLELLMHDDPSRRPTAAAALDRLRQLEYELLKRQNQSERGKRQRRN